MSNRKRDNKAQRKDNQKNTLPKILREETYTPEIRDDLVKVLEKYTIKNNIKIGTAEWKVLNLKTLLPILNRKFEIWRHVKPEMLKCTPKSITYAISKLISGRKKRQAEKQDESQEDKNSLVTPTASKPSSPNRRSSNSGKG